MICPICHKETHSEYKPFCSKRCADIDLGNWMDGKYILSGNDDKGLESENDVINIPPLAEE